MHPAVAEAMKPEESWDIASFDEVHKTALHEGKRHATSLTLLQSVAPINSITQVPLRSNLG